jgi:hypothetical protein
MGNIPFRSIARGLRHIGAALTLISGLPAWGGEVILYQMENFRGPSYLVDKTTTDVSAGGFKDRASSAIVRSGSWQLCTDAYFRGRCEMLPPGEYPTLRSMRLDNQILSAREPAWEGAAAPVPGGPPPRPGPGGAGLGPAPGSPGPQGQVELYEFDGFKGRAFAVNGAIDHFPNDFNDRASSMVIHNGQWEACENIRYGGRCQVFGPGGYASLGGMGSRISSIRPVAGPAPVAPTRPGGDWGRGARALLYENANFAGRAFILDNEVASNFASSGFNDRASSLRVEAGYWVFCSDSNFQGDCLTFGPGDYPSLPPSLNNRISSGRRIREQYPYNQNPNWQR